MWNPGSGRPVQFFKGDSTDQCLQMAKSRRLERSIAGYPFVGWCPESVPAQQTRTKSKVKIVAEKNTFVKLV